MTSSRQMVQLVQAGVAPRYLYSVPDETTRKLVVLAGASFFTADQALALVEQTVESLDDERVRDEGERELTLADSTRVTVNDVDPSWVGLLIPEGRRGSFVQVVPVEEVTIDIPAMSAEFVVESAGPWRWLVEPWPYLIPSRSKVATNLAALRGAPVTEAARWEADYFEAFAGSGPDTPRDEVRFVTLATLLGGQPSLSAVAQLEVGDSIRRDSAATPWTAWSGAT